jgi:hypothetical protein
MRHLRDNTRVAFPLVLPHSDYEQGDLGGHALAIGAKSADKESLFGNVA